MNNLFQILLLSILQGILEWLPVSSEGNILLVTISVFKINPSEAFRIAVSLHIGTMLSAIIFYRKDLVSLLKNLFVFRMNRYLKFILISTISTGISFLPSYIFLKEILSITSGSIITIIIGIMLFVTGFLLYLTRGKMESKKDIILFDALILGIAQGFSIIPGISRSGITVSTLLLRGYTSDFALKTSFILSIPAVITIAFIESSSLINIGIDKIMLATVTTCITGLVTIRTLTYLAKRMRFEKFCILIGILSIISGLINL